MRMLGGVLIVIALPILAFFTQANLAAADDSVGQAIVFATLLVLAGGLVLGGAVLIRRG